MWDICAILQGFSETRWNFVNQIFESIFNNFIPLKSFVESYEPASEEAANKGVDFGFLERVLPTCIKITRMIDHCIHKLSYTDAYLGDVYHDMTMLKRRLLVEVADVLMNESLAVVGDRIDTELLADEYVQVSALLNPARGCRVTKRSANGDETMHYFIPEFETVLPFVQRIK